MMIEISQERLERFWKWCGMRRTRVYKSLEPFDRGTDKWVLGEHCSVDLPRVDLNNLFKWAVPKVLGDCNVAGLDVWQATDEWVWEIGYQGATHRDNATALFLAIEKLIAEAQ